ncbi:synaptogenesis protein syg-2 isoform X1 [Spodoptera frugiperda]|uniref:Synaptogenesis protein syg-2 isoform X1 n=1 Tax=Spodoptera frugiperda TaxID=7108 RepID=A0A9R0EAG2_SPOFR|nr:synaptogenesis protein syg-2 isoform X1 [Spodoptera frugiperda]
MECIPRASPARLLSLWTLLLGCCNIAGLRPTPSVMAESLDIVKVSAVAGGDATLPCDTRSTQASDVLLLVVWYKNDVPLYSYDGRIKGPTAHWADDVLGGRARWHAATPSSLRIRDVIPTDRAMYRCRVDFKISPTRNHKILLDVIELPEKPKIFDEFDKEVVGVAGPYIEDTSLKLTCVVSGGKPMPRIRWWRDDKVIATLAPVDDESRLSLLELRIPKLSRDYFEAVYTCTADNTVLVPPLRVNVQIQLYLRPLFVEILAREQPLSVGQAAELACKAVGARPPAIITWWMDDRQMSVAAIQKNSDDKNETISFLRWTPRMDQDGRTLTCRAAHVKLEHTTIETSITLNLHYVPIVTLELGSKMNPNDIEEGDDVYFECMVRSNPPAYKVVWEHNGQIMTHNQRAGVIAGSANLALQGVNRSQAGNYACTASNVEGDGKSQPVKLQVIYKPVCVATSIAIVGAAINEPTKVTCEVDAFPPPKNFQWTLNNSMGTSEIEPEKYILNGVGKSVLFYTPSSEKDYGSLACRATNLAGQQVEPCRYSLLPAVRPDPLANCSAVNLTDDSAEIRCVAGYDGGLLTSYYVEVWESKNLVANVSTAQPAWILRGLGSGKSLRLVFFAANARGRSETVMMRISTLARLALHTEAKSGKAVGVDASWALGVIAGIAGTLVVIVVIALLARRRQHQPMQYEAPMQTVKAYKGAIQSTNHSPVQPDDKNPDVVPLGKGNIDFNSARDLERPPEPPPYGTVMSPPVGSSRSSNSLHHHDMRPVTPHTPITPASDAHSIGTLAEDRRSVTSGTFSRRREVVTTRTPLLANARESCV